LKFAAGRKLLIGIVLAAPLGAAVASGHAQSASADTMPVSSSADEQSSERNVDHDHAHGFHDEDAPDKEPRERVYSFGLDELVVTASPLRRKASQVAGAVSTLQGTELLQKQQPTLGETVKNLPGVSATYYGPGASRPILRGLGGSRVQILQDNLAVIDASAASNDHAVTVDTLGLERVEILRGPATLRYGPNAVGGVVNVIENRIPEALPEQSLSGTVQLRGSSVDGGFGGAAVLAGSAGNVAWRLKGFGFTAGDVSIPGYAESAQLRASEEAHGDSEEEHADEGEEDEAYGALPNSGVEFTGFSAGAAWIEDHFYVGLAPSYYQTHYGIVFHEHLEHDEHGHADSEEEEPPVTIDLKSWSLDLRAGLTDIAPNIHSIDARLRLTDYEHREVEGSFVATTFRNRGYDLRVELVHERLGLFEGAVGVQSTFSDFEVRGVEAFLPNTHSAVQSLFFIEEIDLAPLSVEFGGRFDYASVASGGGGVFGKARKREFPGGSAAVGLVYDVTDFQMVSLDASWSQRAPNYEELFAEGVHVASGFYEIGDPQLDPEDAVGLNLGWVGQFGLFDWSANAFYNRFWNFIYLEDTGEEQEGVAVGRFLATDAVFAGGEVEVAAHVLDLGDHRLHVIGRADYVWAQNLDEKEALPRIPPLRFGGSLVYEYDAFRSQFDAMRAMAQERVPGDEWTTAGYTMLDLDFSYEWESAQDVRTLFFFRVGNLLDAEARDAASSLRDRAPLPGRNFTGGVRVSF
jgi:iron complex outermembrane receptor protein